MLPNEQLLLICFVVGFIPYFVKRRQSRGEHILEIKALFWSVQYTSRQWIVRVSLIERLRRAIWAIIMHLRDDDRSQE